VKILKHKKNCSPPSGGSVKVEKSHVFPVGTSPFYVSGNVEGIPSSVLVDTGSSLSLIDHNFVRTELHSSYESRGPKPTIIAANGQPLQILGYANFQVELDNLIVVQQFWVVIDLAPKCILGCDFLINNPQGPFVIDVAAGEIRRQHPSLPMTSQVHVVESVCVPPRSEVCLTLQVDSCPSESNAPFLIEPDRVLPKGLQLARTISLPNQNRLVARIANFEDTAVQLFSGQTLGVAEQVEVLDRESPSLNLADIDFSKFDVDWSLLTATQIKTLKAFLARYRSIFTFPGDPLGRARGVEHCIETGSAPPIRQPIRRVSHEQRRIIREQIDDMLQQGIIRPSSSPWSSPVVLVKKKDGSWRFCVDYRKLNDITVKDSHALPRVDDCLDAFSGALFFSALDLASGYWQVPLAEVDKPKSAFSTHDGLFSFEVMAFGLTNAPATFQRIMQDTLRGLHWETCLVYLDDILVFSRDFDEHLERLGKVFDRLKLAGFTLKPSKCHFFQREVEYLGHIISSSGISPNPTKVKAVQDCPFPRNIREVRHFLGLVSYYRRFIKNFSTTAKPLIAMTEKKARIHCTPQAFKSFSELKSALVNAPILSCPDFSQPFIVETDASQVGLGSVLTQRLNGREHPVAFASRSLTKAERNYSVTEREALAIVWSVRHFYPYLHGRKFVLRTDHKPLKFMKTVKDPKHRLARWITELSQFDYTVEFRTGRSNSHADGLSRLPLDDESSGELDDDVLLPPEVRSGSTREENSAPQPMIAATQLLSNWTPYDIAQAQRACPKLSLVLQMLDGQSISLEESSYDNELRHYAKLVRQKEISRPRGYLQYCELALVPTQERPNLLRWAHDVPTAGHLGREKTFARLHTRVYWWRMEDSVRDWILTCDTCQSFRVDRPSTRQPLTPMPNFSPLSAWACDLITSLPLTPRGNKNILVVCDYGTRWVEAFPLQDQTAETISRVLVEQVFFRYGIPEVLHSDQGANFESRLLHEVCALLGVKKTRTTPYHPRGNGLVEKMNSTIKKCLASVSHSNPETWDLRLPSVLFAIRTTVQSSLRVSPYEALFHLHPRTPLDLQYRPEMPNSLSSRTSAELFNGLQNMYKNLRAARVKQKSYFDAQHPPPNQYKIGDLVQRAYRPRPGEAPKLCPKWSGKYEVIAIRPHGVIVLQDEKGNVRTDNIDNIHKYYTRPDHVFIDVPEVDVGSNQPSFIQTDRPLIVDMFTDDPDMIVLPRTEESVLSPIPSPQVHPETAPDSPAREREPESVDDIWISGPGPDYITRSGRVSRPPHRFGDSYRVHSAFTLPMIPSIPSRLDKLERRFSTTTKSLANSMTKKETFVVNRLSMELSISTIQREIRIIQNCITGLAGRFQAVEYALGNVDRRARDADFQALASAGHIGWCVTQIQGMLNNWEGFKQDILSTSLPD
jgi:transposase InsO family protein